MERHDRYLADTVQWFLQSLSSEEPSREAAPEFLNLTAWERNLLGIVGPVLEREHEAVLQGLRHDPIATVAGRLYFLSAPRYAVTALAAAFQADAGSSASHLKEITANSAARLAFINRFPLLARLLAQQMRNWFSAGDEFARRVSADWPELSRFLGRSEIHLEEVKPFLGDPHNGLRCATAVRFREGTVLYKPGQIAALSPIKTLLDTLCRHAQCERLRVPRVLDHGGYAWIEWMNRVPCDKDEDVQRYYRRLGELHALGWVCGAEDLHSENVLACGSEPVVVDLETLMSPIAPRTLAAGSQVHEFPICESGLTTGVLPMPVEIGGGRWVDHSAFGDLDTAELPASHPTRLSGCVVEPFLFAKHFLAGVDAVLDRVADRAREIAAELEAIDFGGVTIRVVLRDTARYAGAQARLIDPECLRRPFMAEAVFDSFVSASVSPSENDRAISQFEREQILDGDIPFFKASIMDEALIFGASTLPGFFEKSALERVRNRLACLSVSGEAVKWSNRAAVCVAAARIGAATAHEGASIPSITETPIFDEAIRLLAERLCQLMYKRGARRGWLTLRTTLDFIGPWELVPADSSLMHGTAGILLFLANAKEFAASSLVLETVDALSKSIAEEFFTAPAGTNCMDAGLVLMEIGVDPVAVLERVVSVSPQLLDDLDAAIGAARILRHPRACGSGSAASLDMARRTIDKLEASSSGDRYFDSEFGFLAGGPMRRQLEAARLRRIFAIGDSGKNTAAVMYSPRASDDFLRQLDQILMTLARAEIEGLGISNHDLLQELMHADKLVHHDGLTGASGMLELWALCAPHIGRDTCDKHIARVGGQLARRIVDCKGVIRHPLNVDSPQLLSGSAGVGYQILRHFHGRELQSLLI